MDFRESGAAWEGRPDPVQATGGCGLANDGPTGTGVLAGEHPRQHERERGGWHRAVPGTSGGLPEQPGGRDSPDDDEAGVQGYDARARGARAGDDMAAQRPGDDPGELQPDQEREREGGEPRQIQALHHPSIISDWRSPSV